MIGSGECDKHFQLRIDGSNYKIYPCPEEGDIVSELVMDTIHSLRHEIEVKESGIYFKHGSRRPIRERNHVRTQTQPFLDTLRRHLHILDGSQEGDIHFVVSEGNVVGLKIN